MNGVYRKQTERRRGGDLMRRAIAVLSVIAVIVGAAFGMAGEPAYALTAAQMDTKFNGDYYARQGDTGVPISFDVDNTSNDKISFRYELSVGDDLSVVKGNDNALTTLSAGGTKTCSFEVDIARRADTDDHRVNLKIYDESGSLVTEKSGTINIGENLNPQTGGQSAAVDVTYTLSNPEGIIAGEDNIISLQIFNRGNTLIKNAQVSLGLPEGMSINNANGSVNAGYIAIGDTYKCKFPVVAEDSMVSKNYPVTVKVAGMDSSSGSVSLEQTLYIPVKGSGSVLSADDVEITNISIPQQVPAGDEFTLAFEVANRGKSKLPETKVTVEIPEGLANKTKNVFVVTGLAAGSSQKCTVTLLSPDQTATADKYQLMKITAESVSGEKTVSVNQYAGTMVKSQGGNAKTPQLMISSYSYGGTYVQAGDTFALNLGLYNTSATQDLVNIKVTVTSDDGTFIPVNSSSSFYIDKIESKLTVAQGISLSAKRDAEQKTSSLTVDMSYEDKAGNAFTAKDVISIPVTQETRLMVDDVVAPPELYTGSQSGLSVNFYNMGKTVLNNLRVNVEGDFDTPQSNMYYVGNMESGKSDSYDFTFIPRQSGPMAGTITFTYEDAAGNEQRYEKPFEVTVMEEVPWEDPGMMDPGVEEEKKIPWIPISIGGAVAAAVIGFIVWKKHRKKKREREMEIDE